ncbi:MAG: 6-bladed beta-propeller [Anaerolineae bacterium]
MISKTTPDAQNTVLSEHALSNPLWHWIVTYRETIAYGLLFVLAVFTRFYDLESRAISHDESLHMLYSYKLYNGEGYRHDPMMHGPFLFEFHALLFFLFGHNNYVGRVGVALFGVALVMLPYWFRPWLGRLGALTASTMILISPVITHYSRHLRHDIFNEVFTLIMYFSLFHYLIAWQRGDFLRMRRWLYIGGAAVALSLTVMEIAYIHGFIGLTFIMAIILVENLSLAQRRCLFWIGITVLVVIGAIVLWLTFGNAGPFPSDQSPNLARQVIGSLQQLMGGLAGGASTPPQENMRTAWKMIHVLVLATGLFFAAATLALSVTDKVLPLEKQRVQLLPVRLMSEAVRSLPLREVGIAVLIGVVIFVTLYTTFFTNPYGLVSGTWGGIYYWLSQQDVQRGGQPWYYYLMLLPLYEFLPFFIGVAGGIWYLVHRLRATRLSPLLRGTSTEGKPSISGSQDTTDILHVYFPAFVLYWVISAIFIYSWAGEKMPWLTTHMSLPLIFMAAWTCERALAGLQGRWQTLWERGGALFALLLPLTALALIALLSVQPFRSYSLFDLRDTGQWLGSLVVVSLLVYALTHYARKLGGFLATRVAFLTLLVILAIFMARSSWLVSFINYDDVSEYLFYAHGAPDVTLAMRQIEDISRRTVGDKLIKVAYDNESTWPLEWYFREYPNRTYYGESPSRQQLEAPIVIVGPSNEGKVTPYLGNNYVRFNYRLVWWPLETYKEQSPIKIWHTYFVPATLPDDPAGRQAAWNQVFENRKALWDVFFYHRHKTPKNQWPYVHRFYIYVRKDVLNQLWDYHTGPAPAEMPTEPYAIKHREIHAKRAVGGQGAGTGRFTTPRAVAVGADGLWYVADSGNNRIQVLDTEGNVVRSWGSSGNAPGQFQEPWGIAVNTEMGYVYVSDTWNHRVQVFDLEGTFLFAWGYFADTGGQIDRDPGGFWGPRDIAIDKEGNIYVADTGNKRIQKFTADGEFIAQWGGAGILPGRFDEPTSLTFAPDGTIYVADTWNRRIQAFSAEMTPLRQWAIESWESTSVVNKPYVRVDRAGNVYVSDPERYRILVFDAQGNFLLSFGQYGADMTSFALPLGMAFEADGDLLVVDSDNHRLLEFPPPLEAAGKKE